MENGQTLVVEWEKASSSYCISMLDFVTESTECLLILHPQKARMTFVGIRDPKMHVRINVPHLEGNTVYLGLR